MKFLIDVKFFQVSLISLIVVGGCTHNSRNNKNLLSYEDSLLLVDSCEHTYIEKNESQLTDYGEPFPIDIIKECIYYNGGKEPQKNILINELIGEWEFERDMKVTYRFNPNMTFSETRDGYFMDKDYNSSPYKGVKNGKFTFKDNVLTLMDYHKKEELHPTDWKKYKNPLNHELVVFSIKEDTLTLYESGKDSYKYIKKR